MGHENGGWMNEEQRSAVKSTATKVERLEAENERLKADVENLAWNLAGCNTIADARKPLDYAQELARPALHAVNEMARECDELAELAGLRAEVSKLKQEAESAWMDTAKNKVDRDLCELAIDKEIKATQRAERAEALCKEAADMLNTIGLIDHSSSCLELSARLRAAAEGGKG